ncbi:TPA: hypothetical protein ACL1SC_006635, partial [Pseudomonas aeruginosa]
ISKLSAARQAWARHGVESKKMPSQHDVRITSLNGADGRSNTKHADAAMVEIHGASGHRLHPVIADRQ